MGMGHYDVDVWMIEENEVWIFVLMPNYP